MDSKLEAARMVTDAGEAMVVANGRMENVLPRLLDGEEVGTLFVPGPRKLQRRSRWIGGVRPAGVIVIDDGAVGLLRSGTEASRCRRDRERRGSIRDAATWWRFGSPTASPSRAG